MQSNKETYSFLQFNPVFIPFYYNELMYLNLQTQNYSVASMTEKIQIQTSLNANRIVESQQKISHQITQPFFQGAEKESKKAQFLLVHTQSVFNSKSCTIQNFKKYQKNQTKKNSQNKEDQEIRANLRKIQANCPDLGKSNWAAQQQQKLKQLVNLFGKRWTDISQHFPNRSGKQIRERYLNYLRPNLSLKKWTQEEDIQIMQLVNKYGRSWRTIQKKLKNRSQNQIKNRYYGHLQKIQRSPILQKIIQVQLPNRKQDVRKETSFRFNKQSVEQINK